MKTMKLFTMLFLAVGVMFVSCDKEGPEGPQGEMGLQGDPGLQGETGEQGPQGEDGNANVIASDWIDTDFDDASTSYTEFDIEIPDLTRSEIDESVILVYFTDGFSIYQAPYVNSARNFYFRLTTNSDNGYDMNLIGQSMNANSYTFDWMEEFRYVIVPQGTSESSKAASMNFEKMSYEEVMNHFGLDY